MSLHKELTLPSFRLKIICHSNAGCDIRSLYLHQINDP